MYGKQLKGYTKAEIRFQKAKPEKCGYSVMCLRISFLIKVIK